MARFTTTLDLISNGTSTGPALNVDQGGRFVLMVAGTLDGATVKLQLLGPDGLTWLDAPNASLSAVGCALVYLPDNATVRASVSGGTAPAGLYARARRSPEC